MTKFIQTQNGNVVRAVNEYDVVEWDAENYCSPTALERDGKSAQFGVFRLVESAAPAFVPITQVVSELPPTEVDGVWTQQWEVVDLDAEVIAANQVAKAVRDREVAKAVRAKAVEAITVTTAAGNTFDGDETSQARMSRAILVLSTGAAASVPWVLANNTVIQATAAELTEALALAGAEQARLWVLP